jgi:hypothetical protein
MILDRLSRPGWLRDGLLVLLAGLVLAILGPFGTYPDFPAPVRYGYWLGLTSLMWLQAKAVHLGLAGMPTVAAWPSGAAAATAAAFAAVPTTFEVAWVESLLRGGRVLSPPTLAVTFFCVLLVALLVCAPLLWPWTRRLPAPAAPDFLARLSPRLGRDLIALQAEDHYLRVHTAAGQEMIHCALSQALAELGDAGARVHRSWWVVQGAVEAVEGQALRLRGGLVAPVGRTYLQAARDAGVIPRQ